MESCSDLPETRVLHRPFDLRSQARCSSEVFSHRKCTSPSLKKKCGPDPHPSSGFCTRHMFFHTTCILRARSPWRSRFALQTIRRFCGLSSKRIPCHTPKDDTLPVYLARWLSNDSRISHRISLHKIVVTEENFESNIDISSQFLVLSSPTNRVYQLKGTPRKRIQRCGPLAEYLICSD